MKCTQVMLPELLRGELSPPDSAEVLAHLERCSDCRERVSVMAILETEAEDWKEPAADRSRFWNWKPLGAAACLVIACAALLLYRPGADSPGITAALATSDPFPYFPTQTRSPLGAGDEEVRGAFASYAKGDYAAAFEAFPPALEEPELIFYRGVSAYLSGRPEQARSDFERTAAAPSWRNHSFWFLANVHLKQGEGEEAAALLEELAADPVYRSRAESILKRIGSGGS